MGRGQIFGTAKDQARRLRYRYGNEANPFLPTTRPGGINRDTLHRHGMQPADMQMCKERGFPDRISMAWNCAMCVFYRGTYERREVYSHVRETHCYNSRIPTARRGYLPMSNIRAPNNQKYRATSTQLLSLKYK